MKRRILATIAVMTMTASGMMAQMVTLQTPERPMPKTFKAEDVESITFLKTSPYYTSEGLDEETFPGFSRDPKVDMGLGLGGVIWYANDTKNYYYSPWRAATPEEMNVLHEKCQIVPVHKGSCAGYIIAPNGNYLTITQQNRLDALADKENQYATWAVFDQFTMDADLALDMENGKLNVDVAFHRNDKSFVPDKAYIEIDGKQFAIDNVTDVKSTSCQLSISTADLPRDKKLRARACFEADGIVRESESSPEFFIPGEQKEYVIEAEDGINIIWDSDDYGQGKFTKGCQYTQNYEIITGEDGSKTSGTGYAVFKPYSSSSQPTVAFDLGILYGEYDIYVVMMPEQQEGIEKKPTQFRVNLFDMKNTSASKDLTFTNPNGSGQNFANDITKTHDMVFVGTYNFKNCVAKKNALGTNLLQLQSYVASSQLKTYTRTLTVDCVILKPHKTEE